MLVTEAPENLWENKLQKTPLIFITDSEQGYLLLK